MKWLLTKRSITLGVIFLVSMFFILFVGRTFNPETLQRDWNLTLNGVQHFRKGLDISGGTKLTYKIDYSKYDALYGQSAQEQYELSEAKKNIESVIIKNIDARISALGVSDYKAYIQQLNTETQIVVEIGGVADLDQAKEIIGKTVELEFRLQSDLPHDAASIAQRKALAETLRAEAEKNPDQIIALNEAKGADDIQAVSYQATLDQLPDIYKDNAELLDTLATGAISPLLEGTYMSATQSGVQVLSEDIKGFVFFRLVERDTENKSYTLQEVFVNERQNWVLAQGNDGDILNGAYFALAQVATDEFGNPGVSITFNEKGKDIFCQVTKNNIGRSMAIFIGGQAATVANIKDAICDGRAQISGGFDAQQAKLTATNLNSGNMPVPLTLVQEAKVSPSLGETAFKGALIATVVGAIATALYMFFIYGWRKTVVTMVTMVFFFAVLLAIIKLIDYALSLSGIAAIILSMAMAVDANILIFERMNEEVAQGKTLKSAINIADARSRSAIRDGQISTFLIGMLLFLYGINMFKGFGSMIMVTAILTLVLNVPLIVEMLHIVYHKED